VRRTVGKDGPADKAAEPLCACEAEKLEGRVALEELGVRDEAARAGFEIEPALGRHRGGRQGEVWLCMAASCGQRGDAHAVKKVWSMRL